MLPCPFSSRQYNINRDKRSVAFEGNIELLELVDISSGVSRLHKDVREMGCARLSFAGRF